jgi:hypothetical protein
MIRRSAVLMAALLLVAAAPAGWAAAGIVPLRQIAVLDLPGHVGFDEVALARGMLLVSHPGAGSVDLFDPQKRRIAGHIADMSSPRGVAVDQAAHLVYIANSGARNIVVVSSDDWQVKRLIPLEAAPDELLVVGAEQRLYVTFPAANAVGTLDLAAGKGAVATAQIDGRPSGLAYDGGRRELFVSVQERRTVQVLGAALKPVGSFLLNASEPTGMAFSAKYDRLYVAVRYAVLALNPETGEELGRSAVAGGIGQLVLDEPTASLLGIAQGSVFVVPATGTLGVASELLVDVKGHTLAYDSATGMLYLPGGREGRSKLLILKRVLGR